MSSEGFMTDANVLSCVQDMCEYSEWLHAKVQLNPHLDDELQFYVMRIKMLLSIEMAKITEVLNVDKCVDQVDRVSPTPDT